MVMLHDDIKALIYMNLVWPTEGVRIFLHIPHRITCILVKKKYLEHVMEVTGHIESETVMNRMVCFGQTTILVHIDLGLESGCLHDCVLPKFSNAF